MPYFTVAEFRARYPKLPVAEYPDANVERFRDIAESAFEDAAGIAFVPRAATETLYHTRGSIARLRYPLNSITAVNVDGREWAASEVAALRIDPLGFVHESRRWHGRVTVAYTYGYAQPPGRVVQAVMILTKVWMVSGPVDERATQLATEDGPIMLSTPGLRGVMFGIPEVDATLASLPRTMVA